MHCFRGKSQKTYKVPKRKGQTHKTLQCMSIQTHKRMFRKFPRWKGGGGIHQYPLIRAEMESRHF